MSPSQLKRQRRSPPAPGSPAFEQLPAVSIPCVVYLFPFFSCPSPYLFGYALREFASATVSEIVSPSPVFGSSSSRYLFSIDSLVAFSSNFLNAGLSSQSCAVVFVF